MKRTLLIFSILLGVFFLHSGCKNTSTKTESKKQLSSKNITNPIHDGYYADPSIIKEGDTYYIYATIDPWGGEELAVLETKNFQTFNIHKLNWPTKEQCTSPTSIDTMVWAPGLIKARNGKYYMYISVGSEIWVGVSKSPLGPWENAKADKSPLIKSTLFPDFHMFDAQCFIDDNGEAYLYWGSGFDWKNGKCFAVKLNKDMISFNGEIKDVTPANYFEAPHMLKRKNKYYLMYSDGKAIDSTYKIRYSVGDSPFGPFEEGETSPIAKSDSKKGVFGPGHHTVFKENGQYFILYHQIFPQNKDYVLRQLRIDSLNFNENAGIEKINFDQSLSL
ncbi:family 43 glycosylhydrolase [Salegentibacter sp. LM13S]|uniref:family 43 glycosylhydrolase n=1 Tax=Salegentibacter lacus TaxID=2873599 RepID=UPI001CCF4014|nr:family 43 glycosylhydrolase [Salegentibacter lacus]MBZ9630965.1 family 43 glycosylhydrolase [Salegentibacter lacus]